jgi:hypothetical protein
VNQRADLFNYNELTPQTDAGKSSTSSGKPVPPNSNGGTSGFISKYMNLTFIQGRLQWDRVNEAIQDLLEQRKVKTAA